MGKSNETLRRLKALAGSGLLPIEAWASHSSEFHTSSARACILVAAAALDATLQQTLIDEFRKPLTADERDEIFGTDRPLGSFSAKIKIAYALDRINSETRRNLEYVRQLRSVFAHATKPMSFETPEVVDAIHLLTIDDESRSKAKADPRTWFLVACFKMGKAISAVMS